MTRSSIRVADEIVAALEAKAPVVALESTLIAHGLPHPAGVETAAAAEAEIRRAGAVPATIAVLDGEIRVGLSATEIERIATAGDVAKLSRRDLPAAVASGGDGATTVAATMLIAERAGIEVFATGGIGGVHRGGEASLDVSADLHELGQTSVAVVCAGVKSILDIGRTLEVLETLGVPVIGFGTDSFPAFYTRDSGFDVDRRVDDIAELARLIRVKWDLGLDGAVLVANPISALYELEFEDAEAAIGSALSEAHAAGISGSRVTPFVLGRMAELTSGNSLKANVELILSNARLAAALAVALAAESNNDCR
ncbi:MAG: pseudouridine-5'-phosphate glycosidase [Gemmatimonadota bacterium]